MKKVMSIIIILSFLFIISCPLPPMKGPAEKISLSDWECFNKETSFTLRAGFVLLSNYLIIGGTSDGTTGLNDIWRRNETGWERVKETAEFSGRWGHTGVVVFNNKKWVIGGTSDGVTGLNDVWYSENGIDWIAATLSAGFSPRWGHTSVVFNNKIWVIGGTSDGVTGLNDVWYSENGIDWIAATLSAGFSPRWGHTCEDIPYSKIILIGGTPDGINGLNDVWETKNGKEWELVTSNAGFSGRWGHKCCYIQIGNIVVIGGRDKNNYFNDVWSTADSQNHKTWIRQNNANFIPRVEFGIIGDSSGINILGGYDGVNYYNDECHSSIKIYY